MDPTKGQTTSTSSYADSFVRERILPRMRKNAIINLNDPGAPNYVSLTPLTQSTNKKKATKKRTKKTPLLLQFRGQTTKHLRALMRKQQTADIRETMRCPVQLTQRLHALWDGYSETLIDWGSFGEDSGASTSAAAAAVTSRLESILRMDLIGSRLRIVRSITTKQVDVEGIVVMETKNIFYLAVSRGGKVVTSVAGDGEAVSEASLRIVPKRGTIFLLLMRRAEVILDGNALAHRPIDRALKKWRLNPARFSGSKQKRRPLYTDLFRDFLFTATTTDSDEK